MLSRYKWALRPRLVPVDRLKELVAHVKLQTPLNNYHRITLGFAAQFQYSPGGRHAGVDYGLAGMEPDLYAVTDGFIEKQGRLLEGTPFITLRISTPYRDEPFWAIYFHAAEPLLQVGTAVAAGDLIGRMAFYRTGQGEKTTGHHLHLQINYGQKTWPYAVNPHRFGLPGE